MLSIDTLILKEYPERGIIESVEGIRGDQQGLNIDLIPRWKECI